MGPPWVAPRRRQSTTPACSTAQGSLQAPCPSRRMLHIAEPFRRRRPARLGGCSPSAGGRTSPLCRPAGRAGQPASLLQPCPDLLSHCSPQHSATDKRGRFTSSCGRSVNWSVSACSLRSQFGQSGAQQAKVTREQRLWQGKRVAEREGRGSQEWGALGQAGFDIGSQGSYQAHGATWHMFEQKWLRRTALLSLSSQAAGTCKCAGALSAATRATPWQQVQAVMFAAPCRSPAVCGCHLSSDHCRPAGRDSAPS